MARPRKLPEGIRVRNGQYYADFYAGGRRVRKRLSGDLDAATEILNDMRARADRADFGLLDNDYSLETLHTEYLRHCRQVLKPATVNRYAICLNNIVPRLAANRVAQVVTDRLRSYRDERLGEGATPRTVNMEATVLGSMLRWAVAEGKIGGNPLGSLKALPHDHPKEGRALNDGEVRRLLEKSPQPWRDIWYALLVTGLRKAELASLTFGDVDWDNREVIIRGGVAKNHRERRLPIENGLWDILRRQEAGRGSREAGPGLTPERTEQIRARFTRDHVFVSKANTPLDQKSALYRAFLCCCDRAEIQIATRDAEGRCVEHVDLHSLRRTFATNLITSGADPETVRQLLGHRTLEMTMKIYTKINNQTKRQALSKLTYGTGSLAPDHVVEYPGNQGLSVQNGHQSATSSKARKAN
jgi:integrase